ncbi:MAG: hypothetical protein ACKO85_12915, partial [Isosphaeraceae bacterium]
MTAKVEYQARTMAFVAYLECSVCRQQFPADTMMNLCPHDQRPVQIVLDLDRLKREKGRDGWWNPPEK